jgi:hypothetical protein
MSPIMPGGKKDVDPAMLNNDTITGLDFYIPDPPSRMSIIFEQPE